MTPQEAAKLVDCPNPFRLQEIHDFVLAASARDLQLFVHTIRTNTVDAKEWRERAEVALDIRLAEDAEKSTEKLAEQIEKLLEIADAQKQLAEESGKQAKNLAEQTGRLVGETLILRQFTKGVFWLTIILAVFAAVQIGIMLFDLFKAR
jgi:DNA anti-recombination protein RmuC